MPPCPSLSSSRYRPKVTCCIGASSRDEGSAGSATEPHRVREGERLDRHEGKRVVRSEEHTSELQSQSNLVCRLLLEKKNELVKIIGTIKATPINKTTPGRQIRSRGCMSRINTFSIRSIRLSMVSAIVISTWCSVLAD